MSAPQIRYTREEFHAGHDARASDSHDWAFRCVQCGTVQSARSFLARGVGKRLRADLDRIVGFSCIGRYVAGIGCDWTCGGLFGGLGRSLVITTDDGRELQAFPFPTAKGAARLAADPMALLVEPWPAARRAVDQKVVP